MIKVSVIIPTYNRSGFLLEAIEAVQRQTRPVHEILVVDDGSTDDTAAVVAALGGSVRYLRQDNRGKSAALNNAMRQASGNFIWICDDDDVALPAAVENLSRGIEVSGADYAFGKYKKFSVDPSTGGRVIADQEEYWPDLSKKSIFVKLLEDFYMYQNATLVAKSVYDEVGPFREDLIRSQDYEMALRIAYRSKGVAVPEVVFLQRMHEGKRGTHYDNFSNDAVYRKWIQYNRMFFQELHETLPLRAYLPLGMEGNELNAAARRVALLQRGTVFARKKMWDLVYPDIMEASRINPETPLSRQEREICQSALFSGYGCEEVLQNRHITICLNNIARQGVLAGEIVSTITEPLMWHARHAMKQKNYGAAKEFVFALCAINGWKGALAVLRAAGGRKLFSIWDSGRRMLVASNH